jgi:hypothetical protein
MKRVVMGAGLLVLVALTLAPAGVSDVQRRAAPVKLEQNRLADLGGQAENLRRILYIELRQALKRPMTIRRMPLRVAVARRSGTSKRPTCPATVCV